MNRRTVLGLAGASVAVGLAGCVEGVQEHFGLTGIIPVEIHSEADRTHNLHIEARELETGRQSYQESIAVGPGETVGPPHLDNTEQSVQIRRIENNEEVDVQAVTVSPGAELLSITVYDDELEVTIEWSEGAGGNRTNESEGNETDGPESVGNESNVTETDGNESDAAETDGNESGE
ncbi:hypothetical protein [Haloterrigena alkaliphila]|uniref:Uncharacterized protein n=1 Tax=Haloterrigena alkaliphila TaxID=2816475 RepID=A0A8A2VLA7_9EURY|nr:hypothetical protein [Haloterrigena alkaliphila]QSW98968.1 hypothetical protein J0X25_16530 [Haloterrigena alkaliphila]